MGKNKKLIKFEFVCVELKKGGNNSGCIKNSFQIENISGVEVKL